jgi:hypothetical protein
VRRFSLVGCFSLLVVLTSNHFAAAADDPSVAARSELRCELAAAKAAARYYWQIDYPQQQQDLNAAIELTEAEVKAYKLQFRQYEPFTQFTIGAPLYMPIQGMKICQREAELRLDRLRQQRNALIRFHTDQGYLLDQRVAEIRAQLVQLEGGEVIEMGPVQ